MVGLVKLLGIAILALGIIFILKPEQMKKWLRFWIAENHLYMGGLLNILIGIILVIAAPRCDLPWVIAIFSVLSFTKGVAIFILGRQKMTVFAEKYAKKPVKALRRYTVLALVFGVLLIWAA